MLPFIDLDKPPTLSASHAEQPTRTLDCRQTIKNRKCLLKAARFRRRLDALLGHLFAHGKALSKTVSLEQNIPAASPKGKPSDSMSLPTACPKADENCT